MCVECTLVLPVQYDLVWLAKKKRGVGARRLNGWGGTRIRRDKTIVDTAIREFKEETGGAVIKPNQLKEVAILNFFENRKRIFKCHVFLARKRREGKWNGELAETDEMGKGEWYSWPYLPLNKMMPADREWLPRIFAEKARFRANIYYTKGKTSLERPIEYRPL